MICFYMSYLQVYTSKMGKEIPSHAWCLPLAFARPSSREVALRRTAMIFGALNPILSSPSPDQFSYYSEAGSPGYVARMMLTIGTKDIHSGPFLQLMVLDKIVSATATGARRFFYDRERPLQQLQPHKIMPYSAPRWVKSNPCSGLTLIAMPY
jgi:hypothetical protein